MKVIEKSIFTENGNIDFFCLLQLLEEERFNYIIPKKLLKQIIGNKDFLTRINPLFKSDEEYIVIDIENIPDNYLDKYGNKIPIMLIRLVNTKKYVVSKKFLFNNVQEYLNNNKSTMSVNEIKWCNRFFDMYYKKKKKKTLSQNLFSSTYSLNFSKYIELLEKDYFNYIIPEQAIHEILNSKELFEFFINNYKSANNNIEFDLEGIPKRFASTYPNRHLRNVQILLSRNKAFFPKYLVIRGVRDYIERHKNELDNVVMNRAKAILDTYRTDYFFNTIGKEKVGNSTFEDITNLFTSESNDFLNKLDEFLNKNRMSINELYSILEKKPFHIECLSIKYYSYFKASLLVDYAFDDEIKSRFFRNYVAFMMKYSQKIIVSEKLSLYDVFYLINEFRHNTIGDFISVYLPSYKVYEWIQANNIRYVSLVPEIKKSVLEISNKKLPLELQNALTKFCDIVTGFNTIGEDYFFEHAEVNERFKNEILANIPENWHPIQKAYLIQYRLAKIFIYDPVFIANNREISSLKDRNTFSYISKLGDVDEDNNKNNSVVCFSANLAMGLLLREVDCLCELVNKGSKMGTNDYGKSNNHMYLRAVAPPFVFNADLVRNIRSSDMIKSKVKNRIEGFKLKRGDYVLFNKLIKEVQEYIRDYEEKGLKSPEETMMDYVQKYKKDSFNNKRRALMELINKYLYLDQSTKLFFIDLCLSDLFDEDCDTITSVYECTTNNLDELIICVHIVNRAIGFDEYYLIEQNKIVILSDEEFKNIIYSGKIKPINDSSFNFR